MIIRNPKFFLPRLGIVFTLLLLLLLLVACGRNTAPVSSEQSASAPQAETAAQNTSSDTDEVTVPEQPADGSDSDEAAASSTSGEALIALESDLVDPTTRHRIAHGEPAPDFSYTLLDGSTHKLSDLQGKKVMINFWATWCPPCNAEMPDIQEASEKFADEGFVVLAVSQDIETELIPPFAQKFNLTFPLIADPRQQIGSTYGVRGMPSSYFLNTDGTIHSMVQGMVNVDIIEQTLENIEE